MENKTQLILDNGLELDLRTDIGFALTYQIDDIRNPATSNASFSKTIQLPGTANNNTILGGLFDINADFSVFNPNIKTSATIYQNFVVVMKGYFQLKSIDKDINTDKEGNNITYNIVFFENSVDIFTQIKDQLIIGNSDATQDLDFSSLNHTLTLNNIQATWNTGNFLSTGYMYPLLYPPNTDFAYDLSHMSPAIQHKTYLEKIFEKEGYELGGSFIDSNSRYDKEVIPYNGPNPLVDEDELSVRQFRASYYPSGRVYSKIDLVGFDSDLYEVYSTHFDNDTTAPNFDNDNNWSTTLNKYTVKKNGIYDIEVNMSGYIETKSKNSVQCVYQDYTPTVNTNINLVSLDKAPQTGRLYLETRLNGAVYGTLLSAGVLNIYPGNPSTGSPNGYDSSNSYKIRVQWTLSGNVVNNALLRIGDELTFRIVAKTSSANYVPAYYNSVYVGNPPNGGAIYNNSIQTITYELGVYSTSYIKNTAVESVILPGDIMYLNDFIPEKMKKEDILNDIIKRYNLFLSIDPTNSKKILLESRDDYYNKQDELDWTYKKDYSKKDKIELLSELQNKELLFTYTADKDEANANYTESTKDIYGQKTISYTNEFVSGTKKIQTPFSPTPLVVAKGNGGRFICSFIETPVPKNKQRVLIFSGLKNMLSGDWSLTDGFSTRTYTQYPYIGHFNDPINPTWDIDYGQNSFYYYEDYTSLPSDNLYNTYWADYVEYVSDGRLVTSYFALTEKDIADVKDALYTKIFVKDSWYWINKIVDFNPMGSGLTKVELLKIKYL